MPFEFEIESFEGLPIVDSTEKPLEKEVSEDFTIDESSTTTNNPLPPAPEKVDNDKEEDPIYLSILEKSGLDFDDSELSLLKDDEEGIITAADLIATKKAKNQFDSLLSKNERIKEFATFVDTYNGDPDVFFKSLNNVADIKSVELSETDIATQRQVVRQFYKEKGFNDSMIEKQITMLENSDLLFEQAKESKQELVTLNENKHKELINSQKEYADKQKENEQQFYSSVTEIVNKGVVNGIPLSKTEKTELMDYMFKADNEGKTQYLKDSQTLTPEQIMMIGLLVKRGLKLDGVIKQAADTQVSKSLRDRIRSAKTTNNVAGGRHTSIENLELEDFDFTK